MSQTWFSYACVAHRFLFYYLSSSHARTTKIMNYAGDFSWPVFQSQPVKRVARTIRIVESESLTAAQSVGDYNIKSSASSKLTCPKHSAPLCQEAVSTRAVSFRRHSPISTVGQTHYQSSVSLFDVPSMSPELVLTPDPLQNLQQVTQHIIAVNAADHFSVH